MIRDLELRDLIIVEGIHNGKYPLPKLGSKLYPVQKVIEVDGKVLGTAYLHLTSEVSLILDPKLSNLTRAKLLKEFFSVLPEELLKNDLEDTHVFVTPESGEKFVEFLKRHFNFVIAKGTPLYLGV